MVSYTKARAESIGVRCTVGLMERPERMICLIAGALLDLLEPALWLLAVLSNLTALQRIAFTWRATRDAALLRMLLVAAVLLAATLDLRAAQDASAQTVLVRLINSYPDAPELPGALYLLAMTAEALGQPDAAALTYRDVRLLAPASGYAEGASDRIVALEAS